MNEAGYLILGYGYVGKALETFIKESEPSVSVFKTSRNQKSNFIHFDLDKPGTWNNLPLNKKIFWTFPPEPENQVDLFIDFLKDRFQSVTVVGTTGSLLAREEDGWLDEATPFDESKERARAEWKLLQAGFHLVLSAGIYGPGRDPLSWVKSDRIGKSSKYVNMIHVEDLVDALIKATTIGKEGQVYIASDGCPQKWEDIIAYWEGKGLVDNIAQKESQRLSKRINSQKTRDELNLDLKFRNFQEAVFLMNQTS